MKEQYQLEMDQSEMASLSGNCLLTEKQCRLQDLFDHVFHQLRVYSVLQNLGSWILALQLKGFLSYLHNCSKKMFKPKIFVEIYFGSLSVFEL